MADRDIIIGRTINVTGMIGVLRDNWLSNRVFKSYDDLESAMLKKFDER
jgi:hypothetical protein